jgi:sugar phosphate isomerase/epimerase
MHRLSMSELTTYRWSFEEDVLNYHAAGVGAMGVWRQKLSDYGEERGSELLAEHGLKVSNLLWAGGFTGSDGRTYREAIRDGADAIRLAAMLRAETLVVYSGPRNGHTQNHARRLFQGALKELLPLAVELGVTLAVEPTHECCAGEWSFLTSLDAALALVGALESEHVKLVFDTYHLGHDARVLERVREVAPHVAVVHLADSRRPPENDQDRQRLGEGSLPLREIVAAFCESGYGGYFDVELLGEAIEACDYKELIEASKRSYASWVGAGLAPR